MRDPYLYEDVPVLRNLLGIKTQELLDEAEADYVVYRLKDLVTHPLPGDYHTNHYLKIMPDMCGQHQLRIMHILQMEVISEKKSIYTRLYMMLLKNN